MSWVAVGTGVASLGVSAFKYFKGRKQSRDAERLRAQAVDPGFRPNQALIDNANILQNRYGNYTLPGQSAMEDSVKASASQAFSRGVQGATSGSDVLRLAERTQFNEQQALNQIGLNSAAGKEKALFDWLNANAAVGNDDVRVNQLELQRYQDQMREASALEQAGATNSYAAISEGISGLSTAVGAAFNPQWTFDNQGKMIQGDSMFKKWLSSRKNNSV